VIYFYVLKKDIFRVTHSFIKVNGVEGFIFITSLCRAFPHESWQTLFDLDRILEPLHMLCLQLSL